MTSQIGTGGGTADEASGYVQPSKTYNVYAGNIANTIDGLEAVRQSVRHILSTERYSNPIYDDNYGVELEQYLGKGISVIKADIENTLKEALLQDDRIVNVILDGVEQTGVDSCRVTFSVYSVYGNFEEALNVLQ